MSIPFQNGSGYGVANETGHTPFYQLGAGRYCCYLRIPWRRTTKLEANDGPVHASEEYSNHSADEVDGGDDDRLDDDVSLDDPDYMPREQGSDQA
eukprot:4899470-Pleurochrysis_carterae.AAC.1